MDLNFSKNNEPKITNYLKKIAEKNQLCFLLTPFILSMNYFQHKNQINFLQHCIRKGTNSVKELSLNVLYFLLRDEEFVKVKEYFLEPMIYVYNNDPSSKVKKLVRNLFTL
jgi:hypothetical protein